MHIPKKKRIPFIHTLTPKIQQDYNMVFDLFKQAIAKHKVFRIF
jgi:hypothetical protein